MLSLLAVLVMAAEPSTAVSGGEKTQAPAYVFL
jgi:hypothetical protein